MSQELTIDQSFEKLLSNLNPTDKQQLDIRTKRESIDSALSNSDQIFLYQEKQPSFLTGSYARNTIIRPIHDIDLYVRIHYAKHAKEKPPLQILRLMASTLRKRYPTNTRISVDSPCVVISFSGFKFEIAPVVCYEGNPDLYDIPAPGARTWMQCYPHVPSKWLSSCNHKNKKMFIPLIKILKQWNNTNKVGLRSFHLELLTEKVFSSMTEIYSYPQGILDWMYCVRNWLWKNRLPFIEEPGQSSKFVDGYLYAKPFHLRVVRNKLDEGLKRAERAWDFYQKGRHIPAKRIWRIMLEPMFPAPEPHPSAQVLTPPKELPPFAWRDTSPWQQTTGLLGGIQTNALLDSLLNPPPKQPTTFLDEIQKNSLISLLSGYNDPFRKK